MWPIRLLGMTIPLFHVEAFTDRPFAGNPAAVCILPAWKEASWLQAVAAEMNLSETAFLVQQLGHWDPKRYRDLRRIREITAHPSFTVVAGEIESWERP